MAKVIKVKSGEAVTPDRIKKAMELLATGGTKKAACDILGIKYNTTRLQKIIDDFVEREENQKRLYARKKGTAVEKAEAVDIIKEYLETGSIDATSKMFHRTPYVISSVLEKYGARLHSAKVDYFNPLLLPDICMSEEFVIGETVWASRYNALAIVKSQFSPSVYCIWVLGKYARFAYQAVEDLGSLRHLEALGINFKNIRLYEAERSESDDG